MNDVVQLLLALFALAGFLWFAASFVGGLRARRWPRFRSSGGVVATGPTVAE